MKNEIRSLSYGIAGAAFLLVAGSAHAQKPMAIATGGKGVSMSVVDKASPRQGPDEEAFLTTLSTKYKNIKLPGSSPLANAKSLRMYVQINYKLGGAGASQPGPTESSWVNLVRNPKTGTFSGHDKLNFVRSEDMPNVTVTRRAVAFTDGKNWYSDFGNNITIAAPTIP